MILFDFVFRWCGLLMLFQVVSGFFDLFLKVVGSFYLFQVFLFSVVLCRSKVVLVFWRCVRLFCVVLKIVFR